MPVRRSPAISSSCRAVRCRASIRARCPRWYSSTRSPRNSSRASPAAPFPCCCRSMPPPISRRNVAARRRPRAAALPGRFQSRRHVRRRSRRLQRDVLARAWRRRRHAVAHLRKAGRDADHGIGARSTTSPIPPAARASRSSRWRRNLSGPAQIHPRRLCALRLHPLRRRLCGVDPVPGQRRKAAAARLPGGLSRCRALPEGAARRRRPAHRGR